VRRRADLAELRRFGFTWSLLSNLPMLEWIDMSTLRADPCPSLGVRITLMNHFNNKVAVQAHRGFAVNVLTLNRLAHESTLRFLEFLDALAI
jgi:hypothetical protein